MCDHLSTINKFLEVSCHHTSLMMMVPSMASCRSCRVFLTIVITLCMRSISCLRKIFIGAMAPIFCSLAFTYKHTMTAMSHLVKIPISLAKPTVSHLMRDVICREFLQHFPSLSSDNTLSCLPTSTRAVLGLDGEDGVQATL